MTERQFEMDSQSVNGKQEAKKRRKERKELFNLYKRRLDEFTTAQDDKELICPSTFNKDQRRELHTYGARAPQNQHTDSQVIFP